jgi:hypothetical protein
MLLFSAYVGTIISRATAMMTAAFKIEYRFFLIISSGRRIYTFYKFTTGIKKIL